MTTEAIETPALIDHVSGNLPNLNPYLERLKIPMALIDKVCEGEEIDFRMKLFRRFIMTYGIDPDNSSGGRSYTPKGMAILFSTDSVSISRQLNADRLDRCFDYAWDRVVEHYDPDGKRLA